MSKVTSSPGSASPAVDDANGYLLLTVPHSSVHQVYEGATMTLAKGELRLECISIPIPKEIGKQTANPFSPSPSDPPIPTHDFWLVLRVGPTFEMSIIPTQLIQATTGPDGLSYTVPSQAIPNASLIVTLPKPSTAAEMEDLDSFEVLLRQYGSLGSETTALSGLTIPSLGSGMTGGAAPLADELRGRLVLVNEDNGEVVGELEQSLSVEEDKKMAMEGKDRPVVLDFGATVQDYAGRVVVVKTVPEDEMDDWMLKGAHNISKGILSFSNWSQRLINSGATAVVNHTTPMAEPVKFHPAAKAGIRTLHNTTVKTMNVTKSTMNVVNNAISTVVEKTYEKGLQPTVDYTMTNVYEPLRRQSLDYTQSQVIPKLKETVRRGSQALEGKPPLPFRKPASDSVFVDSPTGSPTRSGAGTPVQSVSALGEKVPLPSKGETLIAGLAAPPAYSATTPVSAIPAGQQAASASPSPVSGSASRSSTPISTSTTPQKKRRFFGRLILAGEVVLTSLEATANDLITTGTAAASTAAGHKFGPDAGHATALLGGSVRNVAVVYIDVRGVGRRALLKGTAKGFVKTRLTSGETVTLQGEHEGVPSGSNDAGNGGVAVTSGEVERMDQGRGEQGLVVGMTQVELNEKKRV